MIFYSKKDTWLVGLVLAAALIPLLIGFYNLFVPGGNPQAGWTPLLTGTTTGAVVLWLTYPLYYEVTSAEVKIRCGMLIRQRIPHSKIEEVSPTRNPASAPAWSLDRLQIKYRHGERSSSTLISPLDKEGFLRALASRGPGLEVQGNRVVRVM